MNVYKYDGITKEFVSVGNALLDPLESQVQGKEVYLLPANATFTAPLVVKDGYVQVYKDDVWNYIEDNRGKEYWLESDPYGTPARTMKELGAFPVNAVFEAPKKPLELAKQDKKDELKSMRDTLEVVPIFYNGNYFDYDDKARDRINAAIISLDLMGAEAKLSWTTADNKEAMVTANDLRGVIASVAMRSNDLHIHYRTKRELVDKATSVAEVEAIVW